MARKEIEYLYKGDNSAILMSIKLKKIIEKKSVITQILLSI